MLAAACLLAFAAACTEKLESSAACPVLCSGEGGVVSTISLSPITVDTTLLAFQQLGSEGTLLLATRGDTIDTRAVIRFDSMPTRFQPSNADTTTAPITKVDSAILSARVILSGSILPAQVTIVAYDVDSTDADVTNVAPQFNDSRIIGTVTYLKDSLKDSVRIPLNGPAIAAKTSAGKRLRIGLRAVASSSVQFGLFATESQTGAILSFRVSPDTSIAKKLVAPLSTTPASEPLAAQLLDDYTLVVKSPPAPAVNEINVGGLPARMAYMRFVIPPAILDSSVVVRARLVLTQKPSPLLSTGDSITIIPLVVTATSAVTDVTRAAHLTADRAFLPIDSVRIPVTGTGERSFEIALAIQAWRAQGTTDTPHALVFRSATEGLTPADARFYSIEAASNLRPRLEISYSPRTTFGRP